MTESATSLLEDLISRLTPEALVGDEVRKALAAVEHRVWVPNPGPQTRALFSEADELFYGGVAGGGKSDLVIGGALTEHTRSLVLRRFNEDARDMSERMLDMVGSREGYNGQLLRYQTDKLLIEFGGCKDEKDKQRYKGRPHDLIAFDEISDFLESQYRFIIAWNRSVKPEQRVRVICTGNPPTTAEGLWVIQYWAPWLDDRHPNPAREGELRWYTMGDDGKDVEVAGRGPHIINGEEIFAKSRTFIRARLDDNPDLVQTDDYRRNLAALPIELREAYRDGRFDRSLKDNPHQCIPTTWVLAAQERWTERPPPNVPMSAIGIDVAQGGEDDNTIARRHDGWYDELVVVPGVETPLGSDIAGRVLPIRKHQAQIIMDCGGGYGGSAFKTFKDNNIAVRAYKGANKSTARTVDGALGFYNKRTEIHWRMREALDPDQPWGSTISLPPGRLILSDLTAARFEAGSFGIKLESAEKVKERLGRSPDHGYAILLAWMDGPKGITHLYHNALGTNAEMGLQAINRRPKVLTSKRFRVRRRA